MSCFFFTDTAPTEIYTLSLHDALPISPMRRTSLRPLPSRSPATPSIWRGRSEEHTSELQSRFDLVCRLLLEKKKNCLVHARKFGTRLHPAAPQSLSLARQGLRHPCRPA